MTLQLIYSNKYDISIWPLSILHPFDGRKYSKAFNLINKVAPEVARNAIEPSPLNPDLLRMTHTSDYLESLRSSQKVSNILEFPLVKYLPFSLLERRILEPMRVATSGTITAAKLALKLGRCVNLGGGYHHAHPDKGHGFCVYADVPIAIQSLRSQGYTGRVMIVDLDAHQADGTAHCCDVNDDVLIFDIFNEELFPQDALARSLAWRSFPIKSKTRTAEYIELLKQTLPLALKESRPDLVIYNAGTDVFLKDPLGNLFVSLDGILERDIFVTKLCERNQIPWVMVTSGGYTSFSSGMIARSVSEISKRSL